MLFKPLFPLAVRSDNSQEIFYVVFISGRSDNLGFPNRAKDSCGLAKYYFDMCTYPIQLKVTSYQPSDSPTQLKQNTQKRKRQNFWIYSPNKWWE